MGRRLPIIRQDRVRSPCTGQVRVSAPANRLSGMGNKTGGGGEIRTHERLPVAGFQDRCNRPLCHTSSTCVQNRCLQARCHAACIAPLLAERMARPSLVHHQSGRSGKRTCCKHVPGPHRSRQRRFYPKSRFTRAFFRLCASCAPSGPPGACPRCPRPRWLFPCCQPLRTIIPKRRGRWQRRLRSVATWAWRAQAASGDRQELGEMSVSYDADEWG